MIIFIPNEDCYNAEDTFFLETFRLITINNIHEKLLDQCNDMIHSKYCLENEIKYDSNYAKCFNDAKKISTEETTTKKMFLPR